MSNKITQTVYRIANNALHRYGCRKGAKLQNSSKTLEIGTSLLLGYRINIIPDEIFQYTPGDRERIKVIADAIEKDLRSTTYSKRYADLVQAFNKSFRKNGEISDKLSLYNTQVNENIPILTAYSTSTSGTPPDLEVSVKDVKLVVQKKLAETFRKYINDPALRMFAASFFIKEGTYIDLYESNRNKLNILLNTETELINNLKRIEAYQTHPDCLILDDQVIESAKRFLASDIYLEYIGYKEMYEYLYSHGINAFTIQSLHADERILTDKELFDVYQVVKHGINHIKRNGELDEKRYKDYLIEDHIETILSLPPNSRRRMALNLLSYGYEFSYSTKGKTEWISDELQKITF